MMHQVIIGGGPAAINAVETIREFDDGESKITLICDEPAHSRMALPYWIAGKIPREHTLTADDAYFQKFGVDARIGTRVRKVDPKSNSITLDDGSSLNYDNLLIATGSSPLRPAIPGTDHPRVQPLWSLDHTQQLLDATAGLEHPRVVLVGAGFIGFIVLNAMFKRGWDLTVIEREKQVLPRMLDSGAAQFVENWLSGRGVKTHCGVEAKEIRDKGGSPQLELTDGTIIDADIVILAVGIRANIEFLDGSGIATDGAIVVNDRMQTNFPNIYAAGDVAKGPSLYCDDNIGHPIQPTAVDHGRIAGANMTGQEVHYPGSLLMNVVDVCGLQTASFGAWNDSAAEAMTIANPAGYVYRKLLWRGDQIVGAIFTGRPNDLGMLTDVGMVKGILQTQTPLGAWKQFLSENPFDIRRAYVAAGVAQKLVKTTLLGRPTRGRQFQFGGAQPMVAANPSHAIYVGTQSD